MRHRGAVAEASLLTDRGSEEVLKLAQRGPWLVELQHLGECLEIYQNPPTSWHQPLPFSWLGGSVVERWSLTGKLSINK